MSPLTAPRAPSNDMADEFWKNDPVADSDWWKKDSIAFKPVAVVVEPDDSFEGQLAGGETLTPEEAAKNEKKAILFAEQQKAARSSEYQEGVATRLGHLSDRVVEPMKRPVSGVLGRALDVPVSALTDRVSIEETLKQGGIKLPKAGEAETVPGKIAAGTYNAAADLLAAFSNPDAVVMLPAAANKAVLSTWLGQIAGHQPERAAKAAALFKEGRTQEAVQEVVTGAGELALVELGRRHVMADAPFKIDPNPLEVAAVKAEEAGAPATAEALKAQGSKGIAASAREKLAEQGPFGSEPGAVSIPDFMRKVGEWVRPRDVATPPAMVMDDTHVIPRLQEYAAEKLISSEPQGMGSVPILGKILDPRARADNPVDQAMIGHASSRAKGDTIAALWAEENAIKRPESLVADEAGTIPMADGTRGHLSDVIEAEMRAPGSQSLLPEQKAWIRDVWEPLNYDIRKMLAGEKVKGFEVGENEVIDPFDPYFPRIATGKRDVAGTKTGGGSSVGGKQFFQKKRLYESEAEGAETTIYEPDPVKRVATLISRAYKAVADTRLANDESLGGRPAEGEAPLFVKEGTVDQPAFRGKIFPAETAQKLQKHYADYSQNWVGKLSNISRSFQLTLDMSAPFNQGLVLMYRNPKAWGKGVAESWKGLLNPETMGKYLGEPENAAAARELAQLGVGLRRMQDFVAGKTPDNIPGIKQTGRAFGVFMDVAKIEHWKSIREVYPREQWAELAEALDNSLLSGRMESTGITPRNAHYERIALLAPSYYRGGGGLVATALQRGVGGKEARKAVGAFSVGVTATAVAGMLAAGLEWDEIADRLNPSKGKFMRVPVTIGDRKLEAGFGNILLSFARLLGETVEAANSDKSIQSGAENNPWLRFARSKSGPIPSFGADVALGRDMMGKDVSATRAAVNRFTPITVQQGSGEGTVSGKSVDAALSFLGLQAYPQNARDLFNGEREKLAKEKHGREYEKLSFGEQAAISRALEKEERFKHPPSNSRQREMAYQADIERVKRITSGLSDESRKKVDGLDLRLTGYDASIPAGGRPLYLTKGQTKRYEKLVIEEYEKIISKVNVTQLERVPAPERQKRFNNLLVIAKNKARSRLRGGE